MDSDSVIFIKVKDTLELGASRTHTFILLINSTDNAYHARTLDDKYNNVELSDLYSMYIGMWDGERIQIDVTTLGRR